MTNVKGKMEIEIRDAQAHVSEDPLGDVEDDADVTVVSDSLHPNDLERTDEHRVYIEHDHDQGYDVEVYHTRQGDDDWSGEQQGGTVTLAAGQDDGQITFSGPAGKLRFKTTAPSAAIASGSLVVEHLSLG